jgi:hypothetical protein
MNELILQLLDALSSALPLIAAAIVPPVLAWFNANVGELIPKWLYPILLPIAGALVATAAKFAGFDFGDFNPETADLTTWQTIIIGAMAGSASVGIHQIKRQFEKRPSPDAID